MRIIILVGSIIALASLLLSLFGVISLDGLPGTIIGFWSIAVIIYFIVKGSPKKTNVPD